jgi:hypothetical protein
MSLPRAQERLMLLLDLLLIRSWKIFSPMSLGLMLTALVVLDPLDPQELEAVDLRHRPTPEMEVLDQMHHQSLEMEALDRKRPPLDLRQPPTLEMGPLRELLLFTAQVPLPPSRLEHLLHTGHPLRLDSRLRTEHLLRLDSRQRTEPRPLRLIMDGE